VRNPFGVSLRQALRRANKVRLISGYFVPNFRLRRALRRVARRGGSVEIILAGKSDVPIAQRAGRAFYGSLLRAGVKIYEYQPQILHAKLAIVDNVVFAGSANLDIRSFGINYEVMVRVEDSLLAAGGRELFAADLRHSKEITSKAWHQSQTWWTRLRAHWAVFFFTKIDPCLVRLQLRGLS
jgi:cardiolipin synthase